MRRVRLITLRFPFSPTEGSSYGLAQKGRVSAHMGLGQRKGTGKRERDWVSAKGRESAKGTGVSAKGQRVSAHALACRVMAQNMI